MPAAWRSRARSSGLSGGSRRGALNVGTSFDWESDWSGQETASSGLSTADAAPELARQIAGRTNVTLVGHSKGGSLVMEYLAQIAEGKIDPNSNVRRAFTLDSLLAGDAFSQVANFQRYEFEWSAVPTRDRLGGLTARLAQRGLAVSITTLDNPNDWVGHSPIPGVSYRSVPLGDAFAGHISDVRNVYGLLMQDAGSTRRIFGGSSLAFGGGW